MAARSNGISRPNVTCLACGVEFFKTPSACKRSPRHYCSRSCAARINSHISPRRSVEGSCVVCGKAISKKLKTCTGCSPAKHAGMAAKLHPSVVPANSSTRGDASVGAIVALLLRCGYAVSLPFGNNQRYDIIVDDGMRLLKVQCKTGLMINGCISFPVSRMNYSKQRRSYHGQVDMFMVWSPKTGAVYAVPIELTGQSAMQLRIDNLKPMAPRSRVKWAADFEIVIPESSAPAGS